MEAAAYVLSKHSDAELESYVEELIDRIERNMTPDGYFNVWYTVVEPGKRFTDRDHHELYCAGHLIEAAAAYYEATGKRRFLDLMRRYAELIETVFCREDSAAFTYPGSSRDRACSCASVPLHGRKTLARPQPLLCG